MNHEIYIKKMNEILKGDKPAEKMDQREIDKYLNNFRELFIDFTQKFKALPEGEQRKKLFVDLCDLDALFAIQLKLNRDLPKEFHEIAYDFDNPDYPGYHQIAAKILNEEYAVLKVAPPAV